MPLDPVKAPSPFQACNILTFRGKPSEPVRAIEGLTAGAYVPLSGLLVGTRDPRPGVPAFELIDPGVRSVVLTLISLHRSSRLEETA